MVYTAHLYTVKLWQKKYRKFMQNFPMFKNEPSGEDEQELGYYNKIAYNDRYVEII